MLQQQVLLTQYNTFGLAARARWYYEVQDETALQALLSNPVCPTRPWLILGGGSNILFRGDVEALVLHNKISGLQVADESTDSLLLQVGGGVIWQDVVDYALSLGGYGLENLSYIPGTVGAAPIQNIGAYGVEIRDVFDHLEAVDLYTGETRIFDHAACAFGYRDSIFKHKLRGRYMVTRVYIRLQKYGQLSTGYQGLAQAIDRLPTSDRTPQVLSRIIGDIRARKLPDPAFLGNAGSFFKNPILPYDHLQQLRKSYPAIPYFPAGKHYKIPAAWLIEQAGWKGKRLGQAGVYEGHALVLVNHGGASGAALFELSEQIIASVVQRFGIRLEREVQVVGGQSTSAATG